MDEGRESAGADPGSLRERKKARTRLALINAALELFEERGYDATTIDDIAAAADVSPRTFFRYFASKEEVAIGDTLVAEVNALAAARPAGEPILESLRHVTAEGLGLMSDEDEAALLRRLRIVYRTPALRARRFDEQRAMRHVMGAIIAARLGRPDDDLGARVTAAAALAAVETAIDDWQEHDGREDLRDVTEAAIRSLGEAFQG